MAENNRETPDDDKKDRLIEELKRKVKREARRSRRARRAFRDYHRPGSQRPRSRKPRR